MNGMCLLGIVMTSKIVFSSPPIVDNYNMVPSKILRQFPGYDFAFHYDIKSKDGVNLFFLQDLETTAIILFNYEYQLEHFNRPTGYKFVHIVVLSNPFMFEKFSVIQFNLEFNDAVIFVQETLEQQTDDIFPENRFWQQKGLNKCGSVFLFESSKNDFYYVHYYVGNSSGMLRSLRVQNNEVPKLVTYLNKFKDFKGHIFEVAYASYRPFIWCRDVLNVDTGKYECEAEGIDGNILLLLSRYLNFKFVMRKAETKSQGMWMAMIQDVNQNKRDWAVGGMSTSLERMQYCDFTTMIHMESYTAFYSSPELIIEEWDVVLRPFEASPWICLGIFLLLVSITIGLAERVMAVDPSKQKPLHDYFKVLFHTVVDQSIPRLHVWAVTARIMLVVWFLASIILTTAYKSKLAASMISPNRREPNTVLDLYDMGYSFQVNNEDWTVLQESMMNSLDGRYHELLERCYADLNFCKAIQKAMDTKTAILDEETLFEETIFTGCQHVYTPYQMSRFRLLRKVIFPSVHAYPLQLGAPYRRSFSNTLQRLVAAGIIEYWYDSVSGRTIAKSNTYVGDSSTSNALTTDTFIGPAFILIFGEILAGFVFLGEVIYKKYTLSSPPKVKKIK